MSLPPWDQQTFSFGWSPYEHTIAQCSKLNIQFSPDLGSAPKPKPPPAPPYTVIVYQGGYAPLTLAVGNMDQTGSYNWIVNLPLGPTYTLAMKDSAGYTGGVSLLWSMTPGSGCSLSTNPMPAPKLGFTRTGNSQCGNVNIAASNGTSPYQVEIIPDVRQQKTLHFATNLMGFVLDLPAGLNFFIAVTDADGNAAVEGPLSVGSSNDNSCLNVAATMTSGMFTSVISGSGVVMPSSTSGTASGQEGTPAATAGSNGQQPGSMHRKSSNSGIIGGVVGGVVAIAAIALFVWWLLRRRRRRARAATDTNEPGSEGTKPDINKRNPGVTEYTVPYGTQYPSSAVPQIQEQSIRDNSSVIHPYAMPAAGAARQSYSHPSVQHSEVTMHTPQARPPSNQTFQSITYYGTQSSDQPTPSSNRFSQTTSITAPLVSNETRASTESHPTGVPWSTDKKERVVSPPLPQGAMAPSRAGGSQYGSTPMPEPPGSPRSGVYSWNYAGSPPPRSTAGTALPPYPHSEFGSQYQGSVRE